MSGLTMFVVVLVLLVVVCSGDGGQWQTCWQSKNVRQISKVLSGAIHRHYRHDAYSGLDSSSST